ncbi:MAG: glucosaminidase domain-containing protein, partial [Prevotella sp.]|nr:glucosaminidase domain-containing protein [Prevotella sp.]
MKSIYIIGVLLSASLSISAQTSRNADYERYIELYKDIAIEQMQKHRIPASITLAQGLFESGAGKSQLARYSNNHFGIKCHGWTGRKTYHDDDARGECFRVYDNARQSYEDHSRFLVAGSRYRSLFQLKTTDYVGWARGLKKAGYATNPLYADKLIDIIERYELNKYDRAKKYDKYKVQHTSHATKNYDLHVLYTF